MRTRGVGARRCAQYQTCVAVFQRELGVDPDADTKRLYQDILQHSPGGAGSGLAAATASSTSPASRSPADVEKADTPFVGRQVELAQWDALLRDIGHGHGRALFVTGEAGVGKSRLLEEITSGAVARGARLLAGHAWETEQILPFQPWVDALRAGRALDAMRRAASRLSRRAELARLFPELDPGAALPLITRGGTSAALREPRRRARGPVPRRARGRRPRGPALGR